MDQLVRGRRNARRPRHLQHFAHVGPTSEHPTGGSPASERTPHRPDHLVDEGGELRLGGNSFWGEFFSGLIDEVRVYNRVQTAAEVQADMRAPVGTAATIAAAQQRRMHAAADPVPSIEKLTVDGSRTVDGVTVASTLTPRLTTWLSAGRDGEAKVEVEIARTPSKSIKAGRTTSDTRLIWSGHATAKPGDSQVTLQVAKGKLRADEDVRWRARITDSRTTRAWTRWQHLTVKQQGLAQPLADMNTPVGDSLPSQATQTKQAQTRASAPTAESSTGTQAVQAAGMPFPYDRIAKQIDCQLSRHANYPRWRWIKNSFNVCYTGRIGETLTENDVQTGIKWSARISIVVHTYVGHEASDPNPTAARGETGIHSRQIKAWIKVDQFYPGGFPEAAGRPMSVRLSNSATCIADKQRITEPFRVSPRDRV
ncbi:LamG-like jellyroll fold domain-containing protein [Nonomuraea sp. B5E05]|uniref:LamG-like jellyroll fold domain-containing protein n=1 Tax=Nonomuraea sp. B5E05 TaxID=3153569 RepID=UPI0032618A3F